MKKSIKTIAIVIALALASTSCSKKDDPQPVSLNQNTEQITINIALSHNYGRTEFWIDNVLIKTFIQNTNHICQFKNDATPTIIQI